MEAGLGCKGDELSALHLQRFQSRLSGNWDTKSFLVDGEKPGAANSAQAQEEFLRRGSVPTGPKSRTG